MPICLDAYCKAGGAGYGFSLAGFDVIGVDIEPQPHYPFKFYQGDAVEFIYKFGADFDYIHTSPPCQFASELTPMEHRSKHKNWIPETREALIATGKLYDIENVENARRFLVNPIMLCGSMFGLGVWRHRYFEMHPSISLLTPTCNHGNVPVCITGSPRRNGNRTEPSTQERRDAMETQWMSRLEMDQAIPPAYTKWIGMQILARLEMAHI